MEEKLKDRVLFIVKQLTGEDTSWHKTCDDPEYASAWDYLSDAYDIEYIVNGKGEYLGARVLVAFGGPNIWINTRTNTVEGRWWGDSYHATFTDEIGLDEALSEMWDCR
jgi:hypothetical protein